MKIGKILGIAAGALLLVLVAVVAFVASRFDGPRLKAEAAKVMMESKQRTLKIDGELALSFWPNLGLRIGKVSLSEHGRPEEFASVEAARVSVAVLPLLSGKVVVNEVAVEGVRAVVVKHKDGRLNIDDLLSKEKSEDKPVQLDIAAVKVANVQLAWRDEKTGSSTTLSGLDLSTGRLRVDAGRLDVEALSLAAKGKVDADAFELRLAAPRLAVAPDRAGGEATLSASLTGAQRKIDAKLSLTGIEGTAQALKIAAVALDVDGKAGDAALKATLNTALAADLEHRTAALEKLAGTLDIAHPQMPMKQLRLPLSGHLKADLAKSSATGRLATQFDDSKLALAFDVRRFAPLGLGFDLDIDQLDADKYLPPGQAGDKKKDDGKLDLSALKGLDVEGDVRIGSLKIAKVKATNIKLKIRAANGRLEVAPHSANLYDGSLTGSLAVDANGNVVTAKENLAGVRIGPLLKDALDKDLIEGRGNVSLDVTARGDSVAAMKKTLAGTAAMSLQDGALKGINLAKSFRELKAKFSSRQDAAQQASAADKTDFSELSASFRIANGVARNDDLAAKSPFLRLGGSGDIDIGNDRLDYLAKASVVATSGGQGAQDLEYLKGLTIPVRASGPFADLSYRIEFAGLGTEAVKAKVAETTQSARKTAEEKLKGGLGKLLGR
ncbi:MAG: AsmA family protein [Sterolibacteriaceae bacterium MAG5]|nr:AsmA family protein [Candidatus Nitricoxidireducens bremensis]